MKYRLQFILFLTFFTFSMITITNAYPTKNKSSKQDFVDTHNVVRSQVGVGPVTWNYTLATYAQNYANSRIQDCDMEHSNGPYGENLAEGYGEMNSGDAVRFWATEKPYYDYHSNKCVHDECGHYTQLVWRNTKQIGCGKAKCQNGWVFVICSYYPPGNYRDERPF